jgi:hypothetical protein
MSRSIATKIVARYAPFDFSNIHGFPNAMPSTKDWGDCLPRFREDDDDCPTQHLIDFHECMNQLGIYHEDVLMKMFMTSLEGDARQWYKSLPTDSIASLKYFHVVFHSHCKIFYPTELLYEHCCNEEFNSVIEHKEIDYDISEQEREFTIENEYSNLIIPSYSKSKFH